MNAAPDLLTAGLKMIASLGVVLAIILLLLYGIKKLTRQRMGVSGNRQIEVLENHHLGVKKSISLVRVPGKLLVLGICADRIRLLDTLADTPGSALDDGLVDTSDKAAIRQQMPASAPTSFGSVLADRLKRIVRKGLNAAPVAPGQRRITRIILFGLLTLILLGWVVPTGDAQAQTPAPLFSIGLDQAKDQGQVAVVMQLFLLMTVLSLAPSILIMLTSFTRIAIVFSLLRQAMGTNQLPPNQVVIGLALFLTFYVMAPVWQQVNQDALQPLITKQIDQQQALNKALGPIRTFMISQTREKDLALLVNIAKIARPANIGDVPTTVLIPAFIISELKTAFQIGFMLYVPFLIIDMVVASVLLSMGMMMLPPIMVSLPFKLMIFVLADGWHLIVGSLVKSFA